MDTPMDTSTVLTVGQAASVAGVSTKTIRRWLHAGRLEAGRAGDTYMITPEALQRAIEWTPSMDSTRVLSIAPGPVQSTSVVSSGLLDRLERQAERIGHLEAELMSTRLQLAAAESKLLALDAPSVAIQEKVSSERPLAVDSERPAAEPTETTSEGRKRAPWWALWRHVTA